MDESSTEFFFVVCQHQSNEHCKLEIAQQLPKAQLAFSRPGFLTFKSDNPSGAIQTLNSTFIRTCGLAFQGKRSEDGNQLVRFVADAAQEKTFDHLHVFERDHQLVGKNDFEPGLTVLAQDAAERIAATLNEASVNSIPVASDTESKLDQPTGSGKKKPKSKLKINQYAKENESVLDVVLVEPDHWWIGQHTCHSIPQRWPGGVPNRTENEVVSRAYYKIQEALAWSQMPIQPGDVCVEVGSAPGGSCQHLLEIGAKVIAIDPAELDEQIAAAENLVHIQRRGKDVKRKLLEGGKWLICDANASPLEVFTTVEAWLADGVRFRGLLLTLKIARKDWFQQIDAFRKRANSWGFNYVKTRQLAFNRNEICLMAMKNKAVRRFG